MDYLTAQIETWASHKSTRHFWGFSELQDLDPECTSTPAAELTSFVNGCKAFHANVKVGDGRTGSFFAEHYGETEGGRVRTEDAGWVCAQRRPGRAYGWLHSQYAKGGVEIPDYLLMVDDDSYLDMGELMKKLERQTTQVAAAGCLFRAGSM
jgi:hypothetical protein